MEDCLILVGGTVAFMVAIGVVSWCSVVRPIRNGGKARRKSKGHTKARHSRDVQFGGEPDEIRRRRTRNATLFMHVHVPKTSGTHIIHVLLHWLCNRTARVKWAKHPGSRLGHCLSHGAIKCPDTLLDTSLYCLGGARAGSHSFHTSVAKLASRAAMLASHYRAPRIVYVTTLRPSIERVISHWRHYERGCEGMGGLMGMCATPDGAYPAPPDGTLGTNASLRHFLNAVHAKGADNTQVQMLASVEGRAANASDLAAVQATLLSGAWLVGFTGCASRLGPRLAHLNAEVLSSSSGAAAPADSARAPRVAIAAPPPSSPPSSAAAMYVDLRMRPSLHLAPEVLALARAYHDLDAQLYSWALRMSATHPLVFRGCTPREEAAAWRYTAPTERLSRSSSSRSR